MPSTAFVQLARSGDMVSILPIMRDKARQGGDVFCYVHPQFAPILEAVGYVKPILRDTHHRDVEETAKRAKKDGHDEVIVAQVDANPFPAPAGCNNFIQEQWARCGYRERFHDLPLVFDRRDAEAEAKVIRKHLPNRSIRPLLVYSLTGHSSPYKDWKQLAAWVRGAFSGKFDLLDITELNLEKPQHLLPLIESADVCLFSDSLPLHLSYAFCKPTFALSRGTPAGSHKPYAWWWSEPRKHWIGHLTYEQSATVDGRRTIALAISEMRKWPDVHPPIDPADAKRGILHVSDFFASPNKEESRRNLAAMNSWHKLEREGNWRNVFFDARIHATRTSRDLGDTRTLPYLKDVIDFGVSKAGEDEIVCFTNADSVLVDDAPEVIRRTMATAECCYSRRVQTADPVPDSVKHRELRPLPADGGIDLVAFRPKWWRENRELFPDFLIGADAWDCAYSRIIRSVGGREIRPPLVLHERHPNVWSRPENIETAPSQRHNRWLYREWAVRNGHSPVI